MPDKVSINEYINGLPEDRRTAITGLRKAINEGLPKGFKETLGMGGILWCVPHTSYPAGYHCDPSKPLMLMSVSATKSGISLHHMGLYGSTPLLNWFTSEWPKHSSKKLDMGKACVRFKKAEDVPFELIGELATKLTPQAWVEQYEKALGSSRTRKRSATS